MIQTHRTLIIKRWSSLRLIQQQQYLLRAGISSPYSTTNNNNNNNDNSNNNIKKDSSNDSNINKETSLTYQDTFSSVQAISKARLEKMQHDFQPVLNRVYEVTDSLKRLTHDITDSKDAVRRLSIALNELTGYNQIEKVKQKVQDQAKTFELTRDDVQKSKIKYELAISTRSNTQRNINELLQRKHTWTGDDVTQFTELYRLEHEYAKEEEYAKDQYQRAEKRMDQEYMALARAIMERYHDEQLWSDKIRSISTYGTWALMGLNILLFIAVQTIFEPRKRNKLTDKFEQLLIEKVDEEEQKVQQLTSEMVQTDRTILEQQQTLLDLITQMSESMNLTAVEPTKEEHHVNESSKQQDQHVIDGSPTPIITAVTEGVLLHSQDNDLNQNEYFITTDEDPNKVPFNSSLHDTNDSSVHSELNDLSTSSSSSLSLSSNESNHGFYSQQSLIIYSVESALAGSLITALAFLWWK
ncbi:unnamed protein product [Cunninghamella blakesleeana]